MNEFHEGDKVGILPWTYHNNDKDVREATFVRYMAGYRHAIVVINNGDFGSLDVRVQVKDLIKG